MTINPFSLENKTILVTGASSGLGRATAIAVSKMGARLIISGRNEQRLEATLTELEGEGHAMLLADFMDLDLISNFVKDITTQKILREILTVNVEAPFLLTQQLFKNKLLHNSASVVFLSSLYGTGVVAGGVSAYCASKGALISAAKVMALELAPKKIRVNCICPGKIQTELLLQDANLDAEALAKDEAQYPLGHGKPEDVANGVIYLLSDASRWVTGADLIMDGGFSIT